MEYLLDSDVVIPYLGGDAAAVALVQRLDLSGVWMSVITYLEVYEGLTRVPAGSPTHSAFRSLLLHAPALPIDTSVARRCAAIRSALRAQQRSIRSRYLDPLIAATALEYNLTLVSRNHAHYRDIPGLKLLRSVSAAAPL